MNDLLAFFTQSCCKALSAAGAKAAAAVAKLPIMFGDCTGSEVMQRIAGPMVGGIVTV